MVQLQSTMPITEELLVQVVIGKVKVYPKKNQKENINTFIKLNLGILCKGSTSDFDSDRGGSNPPIPVVPIYRTI